MDAKLVLDEKYYYLEVQHERIGKMIVGSSDHELSRIVNQPFKLSTKNCEAVANGYDLDELTNRAFDNMGYHSTVTPHEENQFKLGYRVAFREVLDILGDKKFSEDDMREAISETRKGMLYNKKYEDEYIQSLQQTEWDVEIVMESNLHIGEVVDESYPKDFPLERPKLDANGCIILKRK